MRFFQKSSMNKIRQVLIVVLCSLCVASIAENTYFALADDEDHGKSVVQDKMKDYKKDKKLEDSDDSDISQMGGSIAEENTSDKRADNFPSLFARLFVPGYMNNVSKYQNPKGYDTGDIVSAADQYFLCSRRHPQNLAGYNCDIPNITAQVLQAIMRAISTTGITDGERMSAQPAFGLGVPKNIPGGSVPVNEGSRSAKYTGLELFGYNMKWTSYNGEWDDISPSTSARLLANYGVVDGIKLAGGSLWNGVSSGLGAYIDNVDLKNPLTIFTALGNAFEAGTTSSLTTIADTSDANVVLTHGWTRSGNSVASSFYRVYVLSDKQVVAASAKHISEKFQQTISSELDKDPKLKSVADLRGAPTGFKFDENATTPEFKKKKKAAEDYNKKNAEAIKKGDKEAKKIPEPEAKDKISQKDQLKKWLKGNKKVKDASSNKYASFDVGDDFETYEDFKTAWNQKAESNLKEYINKEGGPVSVATKEIMEKIAKDDDPHYNPQSPISHYVCAHKDGSPYVKNGKYVYLYTDYNDGEEENINKECSANLPIRPTIDGGFFGTGYEGDEHKSTDTRHISNNGYSLFSIMPIIGLPAQGITNITSFLTKMIAQLVNEMFNLAFSPLMSQLGITTIVKEGVTTLRDSIFYPLLALAMTIGAIMMFVNVLRTRSLVQFLTTLLTMFVVFFVGIVIFHNPNKVIDTVENVPLTAENFVATTMLSRNGANDTLCETNGNDVNSGIRSAQCYVWKNVVFNSWVYGQFGVGYSNLYPNNGTGRSQPGDYMRNKNQELVGNPEINMGGGNTLSNWAVYQLSLMTSGTITNADKDHLPGKMDRNLYRLVDLQAGPDGGENSDGRYWTNWTGQSGGRAMTSIGAFILAVLALIAIGKMLLTKIEMTFLMSVMMIGLPFMFLFGLTPSGSRKLRGYLATMLALFFKRMLMVFLICSLLLVWNGAMSQSIDSFANAFTVSATILLFFIIYRPEIMKLFHFSDEDLFQGSGLLSGDPEEVKRVMGNLTPLYVKNKALQMKMSMRGVATGAIGGAMGGAIATAGQIKEASKTTGFIDGRPMTLKNRLNMYNANMRMGAHTGMQRGRVYQNRRTENFMTRNGLSVLQVPERIDRAVTEKASRQLINNTSMTGSLYGQATTASQKGKAHQEFRMEKSSYTQTELQTIARDKKLLKELAKVQREATKLIKDAEAGTAVGVVAQDEHMLKDASKRVDSLYSRERRQEMAQSPIDTIRRDKTGAVQQEIIDNRAEKDTTHSVEDYQTNVDEMAQASVIRQTKKKDNDDNDTNGFTDNTSGEVETDVSVDEGKQESQQSEVPADTTVTTTITNAKHTNVKNQQKKHTEEVKDLSIEDLKADSQNADKITDTDASSKTDEHVDGTLGVQDNQPTSKQDNQVTQSTRKLRKPKRAQRNKTEVEDLKVDDSESLPEDLGSESTQKLQPRRGDEINVDENDSKQDIDSSKQEIDDNNKEDDYEE